jgi:hypothetical protein
LKIARNFVPNYFKNKNIEFCEICDNRKKYDKKIYFSVGYGFWIMEPGWVKIMIRVPGSGINIPDPQHSLKESPVLFR